jgi:hypothetical protein
MQVVIRNVDGYPGGMLCVSSDGRRTGTREMAMEDVVRRRANENECRNLQGRRVDWHPYPFEVRQLILQLHSWKDGYPRSRRPCGYMPRCVLSMEETLQSGHRRGRTSTLRRMCYNNGETGERRIDVTFYKPKSKLQDRLKEPGA